jgi:hypothetical protein
MSTFCNPPPLDVTWAVTLVELDKEVEEVEVEPAAHIRLEVDVGVACMLPV